MEIIMEILILIGIFAFVVAIIFRSNEALDRVGEVEKEVKVLEEEIAHKEPVVQESTSVTSMDQPQAAQETVTVSTEEVPQPEQTHSESSPSFTSEAVSSIPEAQPTSDSQSQTAAQVSDPVEPVEPGIFPAENNVRMS